MPLILLPLWSWLSSFWMVTLIPLIRAIPKWMWYAAAGIVALLVYSHWYGDKVLLRQKLEYQQRQAKEIARQHQVTNDAVEKANKRAVEAEQKLQTTQEELDNAVEEVRKSKVAADVCLPESFTRRLRSGESAAPRHRRPRVAPAPK